MARRIIYARSEILNSLFIKSKSNKKNNGARASAALVHLHQGPRPLDPFRRYCRFGRKDYYRQFRWGYEKFVGFWPKESKENPEGESELSPSGFPLLSPDALHPDGDFVAGPEAITLPSRLYFQSTTGVCFLGRLYFQSTTGVCFLVRPGGIPLCGSRGIIPLVRYGLKAQRFPFVGLAIDILPFIQMLLRL